LGDAGITPNMVLPRAKALDWLVDGGGSAGDRGGGARAAGTPNRVFCMAGSADAMAFPVLGHARRLASCS